MLDSNGNLRCLCGQILAHRRQDGRWELRHRGRVIVFEGFIAETMCDRCPRWEAKGRLVELPRPAGVG